MNDPKPFDTVVSLAGHDSGRLYMVVGVRDGRLLLCDGRNRRTDNPKLKSPRHVRVTGRGEDAPAGDSGIRKTLALAAQVAAAKEERRLG